MEAIIYFDMDGVLARWNASASLEDTYQPGYFLERELEEKVADLIKGLREKGYDVRILSAAYLEGSARKDKILWLKKNGIEAEALFVPYGTNKADVAPAGQHILIDDFSRNLREWEAAGHIGIKFRNGINGTNGTWGGFSIDHRMTVEQMETIVSAVAEYAVRSMRRK